MLSIDFLPIFFHHIVNLIQMYVFVLLMFAVDPHLIALPLLNYRVGLHLGPDRNMSSIWANILDLRRE